MGFFQKKKTIEKRQFDREHLTPVLRCSICTGEQVAGFKDRRTGKFTDVMLIRRDSDLEEFKEMYDVTDVPREY